jgi:hypothetical protein
MNYRQMFSVHKFVGKFFTNKLLMKILTENSASKTFNSWQ